MDVKFHGGIFMENKNVIIAVVLGALVLIALFQAFQLVGLKDKLGGTVTAAANAPAPQASGGSGASLPSNLQNLPSMVGGC